MFSDKSGPKCGSKLNPKTLLAVICLAVCMVMTGASAPPAPISSGAEVEEAQSSDFTVQLPKTRQGRSFSPAKGKGKFPSFDEVPHGPFPATCRNWKYQYSYWFEDCLIDVFDCNGLKASITACCRPDCGGY